MDETAKTWTTFPVPLLSASHVVPDNDLIGHELREDCVCLPDIEIVPWTGGPDVHLYTHHSLDGRERDE